ncbi:MAG: HAMP domain-containing histidine kinase [Coriobacteriia bacterium]|nr:HAMP domain-containing histidine kinase [Coriobacteriia bacterium]
MDALILAVLVLISLALASALVWATARLTGASRRVAKLRAAVSQMRAGNLAHRAVVAGSDGVAALADDINEWAEEIQSEREDERNRDAAHKRLISNISHDLRTPITSIAGYVDALERGLGDDPKRHVDVLVKKTAELTALTEDLFFMTKLDSGDLQLQLRPVRLDEIVRQTLLGFEQDLASRGVTVTADIPDYPCVVQADESALRRVLTNLMANSLRHAKGMTRFSVAVLTSADGCGVRISDDGAGFTKRVEDLFERGAKAGPGGGSGLGLSIAHDLAERMGASISAHSEPGEGTAITLEYSKEQ